MLYIDIRGKKEYLDKAFVKKYKLKTGMVTPLTGYKIFEDDQKDLIQEKQKKQNLSEERKTDVL